MIVTLAGLALINLNINSTALITHRSTNHNITVLTISTIIPTTSILATVVVIVVLITIVIIIIFAIILHPGATLTRTLRMLALTLDLTYALKPNSRYHSYSYVFLELLSVVLLLLLS